MNYLASDIEEYLQQCPFSCLKSQRLGLLYLEGLARVCREYDQSRSGEEIDLGDDLDFLIVNQGVLNAFDAHLCRELTQGDFGTWEGIVSAAWLTVLKPQAEFGNTLKLLKGVASEYQWIVNLAIFLSLHEGEEPPQALLDNICIIRKTLNGMPKRKFFLRQAPTESELSQLDEERELVRDAYRRGGVDEARKALVGTLSAQFVRRPLQLVGVV